MALADAIAAIADAMEEDAKDYAEEFDTSPVTGLTYSRPNRIGKLLRSFSRELRIAIKASEGQHQPNLAILAETSQTATHRKYIEEARKEFRKETEAVTERMVECRGGISDGCMFPVTSDVPLDAYIAVAGERYQLRRDGDGEWLQWTSLTPIPLT